jgi:hypothetical protein
MSNPLAALPAKVRQFLYLAYAFAAAVLGGLEVADVERIGTADVTKILAVLAYAGAALGLTAASNMPSVEDVTEGQVKEFERLHEKRARTARRAASDASRKRM